MKTFTINPKNEIIAFANTAGAKQAAPEDAAIFSTEEGLSAATAGWSMARLVEIWNSLAGVTPVKKFTNRRVAVQRIWKAIQHLQPVPQVQRRARDHAPKAAPKATTKRATVLALLNQPQGATLGEIIATVSWQPHSVRGFLSNLNRTGTRVESTRDEGRDRVYRITSQDSGPVPGKDGGDQAGTGEVQ